MHGLIFETSICYWQDQPDKKRTRLLIYQPSSGVNQFIPGGWLYKGQYVDPSTRTLSIVRSLEGLKAFSPGLTHCGPNAALDCSPSTRHLQDKSPVFVSRSRHFCPCLELPALVSEISLKDLKR